MSILLQDEDNGQDQCRSVRLRQVILLCKPCARRQAAGCLLMQAKKSPGLPSSECWESTGRGRCGVCGRAKQAATPKLCRMTCMHTAKPATMSRTARGNDSFAQWPCPWRLSRAPSCSTCPRTRCRQIERRSGYRPRVGDFGDGGVNLLHLDAPPTLFDLVVQLCTPST